MSYATKEEIASEFKRLSFTGVDPVITEAEVDRFIEEACAMIDSCICVRYLVPITDATSLLLLKKITIDFVAYRIEKILTIKNVPMGKSGNVEQSSPRRVTYEDSLKFLYMIKDGKAKLPGAQAAPSGSEQVSAGSNLNASGSLQDPVFQRYKEQW